MVFNSLSYFLFLPLVYLIFHFTADRWRWLVLLVASYGFYAALEAPYLILVLFMVTGISYVCGICIAMRQNDAVRKRWLWGGSFVCVTFLAFLKYFPFFETRTNSIFGLNSTISETIISIGTSYFTFQAISYLADIYLEIEEPEKHFGHYALFLAFFPKLLQGPLERAGDLLPQLKQTHQFDYEAMRSGMLLFTCGLFKKVVVADRLAFYADKVFNNVHDYTGLPLIVGIYAYALQIYFDFAGYTDMARGAAGMFGINLTENFNSPYLATSVADFWRRWHISFSRWILDYIFKPLQMGWRNQGQAGTAMALVITFLASGIWHGAAWGFVIWGLLHGIYLAASTYYRPYKKKLHNWLGVEKRWLMWWQVFVTFNLIVFAWIFFRANTMDDAVYIIGNCFSSSSGFASTFWHGKTNVILVFSAMLLVIIYRNKNIKLFDMPFWFRWGCYYSLVIMTFLLSQNGEAKFIYFNF